MSTPIVEAAKALSLLLRCADHAGLPAPASAYTGNTPHSGHDDAHRPRGGIVLYLRTTADLDAWTTWCDWTAGDDGLVHAHAGSVPLTVVTFELLAAEHAEASA